MRKLDGAAEDAAICGGIAFTHPHALQPLYQAGEYEPIADRAADILAADPPHGALHYNFACAASLAGRQEDALRHLWRGLELDVELGELAKEDSDLDALGADSRSGICSTLSARVSLALQLSDLSMRAPGRPTPARAVTRPSAASLPSLLSLGITLLCASVAASGCAFESPVPVQFSGHAPATVQESSMPEQSSSRVQGMTTRNGQRVGVDCSSFIDYAFREGGAGMQFLLQQYLVHLRTRPLPSGTAYALNCSGGLIVEIPAAASEVRAVVTNKAGRRRMLPLKTGLNFLPLAFGRRLRADPGTQLALVGWPNSLLDGDYETRLSFTLARVHSFQERALYAASISCAGSRYLQPILPVVSAMKQAPAFTIQPSAKTMRVLLPRIHVGDATQTQVRATLSCRR